MSLVQINKEAFTVLEGKVVVITGKTNTFFILDKSSS